MATGFFWDERCFWHSGGNFTFLLPVGGLVQPAVGGGLPENPETKRRLKNLMEVTGLWRELDTRSAAPATEADLLRVHTADYMEAFRAMAAEGGGELGLRAPFGPDGYDIACLSAGLAKEALFATLRGEVENAYALSRPPGHHCLPDFPNGFCLLNNIAIAVEAAFDAGMLERVAVLDWDVHHGNGTEAIFLRPRRRPDDFSPPGAGTTLTTPAIPASAGTGAGRGLQHQRAAAAGRWAYLLPRGDGAHRAASADGLRTGRYRGRLRLRRIGGGPAVAHDGQFRHLPCDDRDDAGGGLGAFARDASFLSMRAAIPRRMSPSAAMP